MMSERTWTHWTEFMTEGELVAIAQQLSYPELEAIDKLNAVLWQKSPGQDGQLLYVADVEMWRVTAWHDGPFLRWECVPF